MKEYRETSHSLLYKANSDLTIYSAGYEECTPGHSYGPEIRPYQMMHFILQGKGKLYMNQQVFSCQTGDVFLVPAGKVSFYQADSQDPWSYAWVNFLGINSEMYLHQLMSASRELYVLRGLETKKYQAAVMKILSIPDSGTSGYFLANSIFLGILSHLFADIGFQEESWGEISVAEEVKFYLDMKYSENLKLQDVARNFGIHPNYLTRIFRESFGVTPKHYLMDLKLKKACRLLATTGLPIAVISDSLGFQDPLAFSKLFKKEFQASPSDYRKQHAALPKEG